MSEKSPNLILKYAIFGFLACLVGAFISQQLGYNDGSLQTACVDDKSINRGKVILMRL